MSVQLFPLLKKKLLPSVLLPLLIGGTLLLMQSFTLVIDAGHGGQDPGAMGVYSKEKNINLNVALKVGELVRKNCPDVKVIYTRKTDVFIPLYERAAIANRAKADLFISIHTDAVEKGRTAVGATTYSLGMARSGENLEVAKRENAVILYESNYESRYAGFNPKSSESYIIFEFMQDEHMKQSAELAASIQKQYIQAKRPSKGVRQAGFLVLRETSMPSVLTELGFISTPSEEQYLNSSKGTDEMATSIYNGFVAYKSQHYGGEEKTVQLETAPAVADKQSSPTQIEPQTQPESQIVHEKSAEEESDKKKESTTRMMEVQPAIVTVPKQEASPAGNGQIEFRIQIMTSSRQLRLDSQQFKGLSDISFYREGNVFKYTYGASQRYSDIVAKKKDIADKFPDGFVIALQGDKRITVQEARKLTGQ